MPVRLRAEKAPFELIEEAVHLVRLAPAAALAAYFVGTLPFLLALLFFWSDMSRSAFADQRLIPGAILLTTLFVWMKCWQSLYCRHLLARLCGESAPRWSFAGFLRTAVHQAIVQPVGLFLLPCSLLITVPFGWVYAFFSSATVVLGTEIPDLRTALQRSWRQMKLWPMQNHAVITLLFLFGLFVFVNLLSLLLGVPFVLKTVLGVESVFTRNVYAAMNSTLLTAQVALTYLCLDPILKSVYVLRCFYGESLRTGQDLRADLNSLGRDPAPRIATALVCLLLAFGSFPALAATEPARPAEPAPSGLSADRLDHSIERTIQNREYSWRLPREKAADKDSPSGLSQQIESMFKAMGRWIRDFVEWISRRSPSGGSAPGASGPMVASVMEVAMILFIALLLGAVLWLLIRVWQNRPALTPVMTDAQPAAPDLEKEDVSADELPEDGWLRLARELLGRGELRLALRAFYLSSLSQLDERNLITLARFKSNRDYERELARRAHALGALPRIFSDNMQEFERVWYGSHPATAELIERFSANLDRMKGSA